MRLSTRCRVAAVLLLTTSTAFAQEAKIEKRHDLGVVPARTASRGVQAMFSETFDTTADGAIPTGWTQFEAGNGSTDPAVGEVWGVLPYSATDPSQGKAIGVFFEAVDSGGPPTTS